MDVTACLAIQFVPSKRRALVKQTHRRVVVLVCLVSVLTLTSALLLALAPAPLNPDPANTLFAIEPVHSMDAVFQTDTPLTTARWKYIYIHHSNTPAGNALSLAAPGGQVADHFVIGNGEGGMDGQIQIGTRWNTQTSAGAPQGAQSIDPDCISICLIGDLDRNGPTPTQLKRLEQLVTALQGRLRISATNVSMLDQPGTAAGVGRYFPQTAFREQLLP